MAERRAAKRRSPAGIPAMVRRLPSGKVQIKIPLRRGNPLPAVNPRIGRLSVPDRHLLKIARDTLRMSDAMARIMGGPSKQEARQIIYRLTGRRAKG